MQAYFNVIVSNTCVKDKANASSWTDELCGKWQDDNITAEDFVKQIRANRNRMFRIRK